MNENNKTNISKSDLLNIRKIIENEMNHELSDPLFLTDIISIDENKVDKKNISKSGNLNTLIKNIIRDIISKELKIWLEKNLSSTLSPILKDYLLNSRKKISGENKENKSKERKKQISKINKTKRSIKNLPRANKKNKTKFFEENYNKMTLKELQKEVLNKGIKLDRRNGKKTLISLLSEI